MLIQAFQNNRRNQVPLIIPERQENHINHAQDQNPFEINPNPKRRNYPYHPPQPTPLDTNSVSSSNSTASNNSIQAPQQTTDIKQDPHQEKAKTHPAAIPIPNVPIAPPTIMTTINSKQTVIHQQLTPRPARIPRMQTIQKIQRMEKIK